jgi:hypothetical protein
LVDSAHDTVLGTLVSATPDTFTVITDTGDIRVWNHRTGKLVGSQNRYGVFFEGADCSGQAWVSAFESPQFLYSIPASGVPALFSTTPYTGSSPHTQSYRVGLAADSGPPAGTCVPSSVTLPSGNWLLLTQLPAEGQAGPITTLLVR